MSEQNAQISPFLSESHIGPVIAEYNLKPNVLDVLLKAKEKGSISPREISAFMPESVQRDRMKFKAVMAWIAKLLRAIDVVIVIDALHVKAPDSRSPVTSFSERPNTASAENVAEAETVEGITVPTGPYEDYEVIFPDLTKGVIDHQERVALFYKKIQTIPVLKSGEVNTLVTEYQRDGNVHSRNKVVVHNLRWAMKIAGEYERRMPFDDCFQEGAIGLMRTVEKFEPAKGFRFATYATWWIRQKITRAIVEKMPTIRLPQHAYELRVRVLHTACELAEDLHREPTLEEISAKCGDPVELVDRALNQLNLPVMSLGELVDSEGNHDTPRTIQDTIADDQFLDPVASMETGEELERASDEIRVLLATLQALSVSDRNKDVFKKYYGLGGYQEDATLESVSEDYDVTRERIRQLNNQTWARLREAGLSMDDAKLMAAIANVRRLENLAYRETTYDILPRNLKTVEENAINVKDNPLPVVEYVCRMRASGFSAKPQRRVTVHDLLEEICGAYGTTMRPLLSRNQEARAAFLRHIAMYVLHTGLGLPVDEIESYFSGYDASMIQNVCERIETLVSNNEGVREDVEKIQSWCNPSSN